MNKDKVLKYIREQIPELVELSFGCEFEWQNEDGEFEVFVVAHIYGVEDVLTETMGFTMYAYKKSEMHPKMFSFDNPYDYEEQNATFFDYAVILGHPVELRHVLQVMPYEYGGGIVPGNIFRIYDDTEKILDYDLTKSVEEQDETFFTSLAKILDI